MFNDINVYNVNAEKRNGAGFPYDDEGNKKIVSLNGKWKFKYAKKIADIPENYYAADYDVSNFDEITVPSNWQIEGYGRPQYLACARNENQKQDSARKGRRGSGRVICP